MTKRTPERLKFLGYILCDGLNYSWFDLLEIDVDAVKAKIRVDTGETDPEDETGERNIWKTIDITADDIARGLRMYRECLEGKREEFPGQWKMAAEGNRYSRAEGEPVDKDSYGWQLVKADRTNGDEGDYDANTADAVMQFATLGYAMYS